MSIQTPHVLEIDRKLRDDFRRRIKDFGVSSETTDPLLAVLFRTMAQQIEQVYSDTDRLRQSLLHELMSGLDMQQYLARPAQTAVRLINQQSESRILRAGTELNATASTGERLLFSLDATIEVSQARIALALSYQDNAIRFLSGVEASDSVQALRPSLEPVPINLGQQPALFLAVENLSPSLLSRHGLFFDLGPGSYPLQHALCHEPWWLFGADGDLSGDGLLRSHRGNAGVYRLEFQTGTHEDLSEQSHPGLAGVPDGFYSGRQFLFPAMESRRDALLCHCPRLLEPAIARLLHSDASLLLSTPRIWIKIPIPKGTPAIHHAINDILLHTMTASNVFARNRTVEFERDGLSIPVVRQSDTPEHLVAPISVMSVENEPFEVGNRPQGRISAGHFELHNGRLTLYPGTHQDGTPIAAANIRLWLTNGEVGNRVGPGDITGFANPAALMGMRMAPFTAAAGGSDGEDVASAERRFADALLTRGRIVTQTDLKTAALAIDRRILAATTSSGIERRDEGLRRVERLLLTLDSTTFTKPEVELPALRSQVDMALRSRLVQGLELEVEFEWS